MRAQPGDRDLQILHSEGITLDGDSIELLHDPAADRNTVRFQLDIKELRLNNICVLRIQIRCCV